jgi:TPR repeat protein
MRAILLSSMLILMLGVAAPARADFMAALAAYDAGEYAAAFTEWRRLAAQGDAESQVALAGLYEAGLGAPRDDRAAARWYREAALRGHRIARLNLGELYAQGRGVGRDRVRAWYWLGLAAADGSVWARDRQAGVARRMTDAERQRARAMLESVRPAQ